MSNRQRRGRYPKGSALFKPSNAEMASGGMAYSHASEVPFYNVQQTSQIAQHTTYSDGSALQHHSITATQPPAHQPAQHNQYSQQQTGYWHEDSSYGKFNPMKSNAWDWTPHTVSESTINQQSSSETHSAVLQPQYFQPEIPSSQYQDSNLRQQQLPLQQQQQLPLQQQQHQPPPLQQQHEPPLQQQHEPPLQQQHQPSLQQHPLPLQQQQQPSLQQQHQPPPLQQQQLPLQQQQQPPLQQQQQQLTYKQPVNNVYNNTQNYVSESLPLNTTSNASYPPQSSWYPPNGREVQIQNSEQSVPDVQQMTSWEPTIPNISQAEQIQWTYNVPQNTVSSQSPWHNLDASTNCAPVSVSSTTWSHQTNNHWFQEENTNNLTNHHNNKSNIQERLDSDLNSLPVSDPGVMENTQLHSYQENNVENLRTEPTSLNTTYTDNVNNIPENLCIEDSENGTVSTFFSNSLEESIATSNEQLSAQGPHLETLDMIQIEEQMTDLSIIQPHTPLIPESNDCASQHTEEEILYNHNSFLQKEVDSEQPAVLPFLPSSTEEPLNQEVPDPHDSSCVTPIQDISNQVPEEPLNQQIPAKTDDTRPSEARKPTPERVPDINTIGHREESPFKPPSKLKNSTGPVVQKESNNTDIVRELPPKDIGIHDVNLETLPDNLERPFDQDRPQRQWHSSRLRRHLRDGDDESPSALDISSTSLLDSPDIPCITLALAAPPVSPSHSHHAKSTTPSLTDGSEFDESQTSAPVAVNSESIVKETITSPPPSYEKSAISIAQDESLTPLATIYPTVQPVLLPALLNEQSSSSSNSTRDNNYSARSLDQKKEWDEPIEKRSNDRGDDDFKTSSPIKEIRSFEALPSEKYKHERDSRSDERNYSASDKDVSHSRSSRDQPERRHYRDYDNRTSVNHDDPNRDRNVNHSRQRFAENRQPSSFDDRSYSDRDGSRPSSRMSLNETSDNRTFRDNGYRKHYSSDYERPPSRLSESEAYGSNKRRTHYDRESQYYREEDYYRRSRHYGEYDYDPYASAGNAYYRYYYPYGYNYNYGFYDELYRNDPRYKQQMEDQYREYYRRLGYEADPDRLSVHSGRSSANELAKDMQMRYPEPDGHSNGSEYSSYVQQADTYSEDQHSTPSIRLTPSKFSCPHPIARFSNNGLLITLMPKLYSSEHSAFVEIHDVQILTQNLETYEELKSYEGPLIRGETHKNDIIDFCVRKIKFYKQKVGIPDRESYILLWELLVLLLRQNGSVAGSDIAELLLKNHEIIYPQLNKLTEGTSQDGHSPTDGGEHSVNAQTGDNSSPDEGIVVAHDRTILNAAQNMDPDKLIRKYREFLLFGHKKDALEYAVKHGLWSHALFLASKMDVRTYSSVLMRFTNSLALNDPLQSLYQLMSGRQPTAVTCIADKQWGDWRPHLAMILSNPSSDPDNDSKSITTLGDTLAVQGCLPAAHFCYLMAQVEFGHYSSKNSKMVLLGANHLLPFNSFASNEAIQCTEIYEYAQSLANPGFVLNHFQTYKFLYATRLVDHGFLPEALRYCEVLSSSFVSSPYSVSLDIISQIYELANKLKFHDPYYLPGSIEIDEDPSWLKLFSTTLQNRQNNVPYQSDSDEVPSDGTTNVENLKEENESPQELANQDIQNQNYYNNESQQNYYNQENQSYYLNNNAWTGETNSIQNTQLNTYDNQSTQLDYNQYSNNTQPTQWNLNSQQHITEQYQGNESIESATDVSPMSTTLPSQTSPQSFTTSKFDFHGTGNQHDRSSALSLPSVSLNSGSRLSRKCRPYKDSEDLEMLVRKEETESDTALFSSSQSTPLHLIISGDDDKQMLVGQRTSECETHALNSCLKSTKFRQCKKDKKCIKFDSLVLNHPGNTREKTKFQHNVIHRRRNILKKPPDISGTSDSSPDGSPSKQKKKTRSKMSIFASFGFGKGNEQSKVKMKRKRKSRKKNDTTEKILHSKKTFAIDEPCDSEGDDEQWTKAGNSPKENAFESEQIITLLEKLSAEQQENTKLGRLIASEFKKKPPLIYGGTFPIDEPCDVMEHRKSRCSSHARSLIMEETNISIRSTSEKSSPLSPCKLKTASQSKIKKGDKGLRQPELALRSKVAFKMFRKLRSDKKSCSTKILSSGADSLTSNSSPVYTKPKPSLVETRSVYSQDHTSSVSNFGYQKDRHDSNISSGSDYGTGQSSTVKKKSSDDRVIGSKEDKSRQQVGRSWLGGIFNRLLPKAPNQMILPDDKDPTIVWDDTNKVWKNTDGSEAEDSLQPVAPPTDIELLNQTSSSDIPASMPSVPSPPSSLMTNRFKRLKGKGMRDYIDVLNPSASPATKTTVLPDALFPSPLPLQQQQQSPQLFVPSGPVSEDRPMDFVSTGQAYISSSQGDEDDGMSVPDAPIMYDPAEFNSRRSSVNTLRHSVGPARRTYPT